MCNFMLWSLKGPESQVSDLRVWDLLFVVMVNSVDPDEMP